MYTTATSDSDTTLRTIQVPDKSFTRRTRTASGVLIGMLFATVVFAEPKPNQPVPSTTQQEDDLSKKLIQQAITGAQADVMSQVTSLMQDSERLLTRDLDPGPDTQAVQDHIVQKLDDAIARSLQQRSRGGRQRRAQGEKRTRPDQEPEKKPDADAKEPGDAPAQGKTVATSEDSEDNSRRQGPLREARRGWGHLPQRDRDELLQGVEEEFIERYREQIEQYYRSLTESDENR